MPRHAAMIATGSLRAPRARFAGLAAVASAFALIPAVMALILAGCTEAKAPDPVGEAGPAESGAQSASQSGDAFGVLPQAHPADTYTELTAEERALVAEAADAQTPPARLAELALHENRFVRQAVAGNTSAPPEALAALAADVDLDVRLAVAENPSTPEDALQLLLHDLSTDIFGNYYVREAAARNLARRS
ncbi:MAG: hypothetical protein IJG53_07460 [Eggerthellaceae bacterium]|nr:hypothetical protein [Eggerthellaceae bacterium]